MSSRVAFSQPALLRTLSDDEAAAVNVLFADSGLLPIDGLKEYSFAERLSVDGTVYHSAAYKRAGKSCSKIVQFFSQVTEPEHLFGEVQAFVTTGSIHLTLLKQYPILVSAICSVNINPPSDEIVKIYADAKLLGSHHVPVAGPSGPHLCAVFCENIVAKCVKVEVDEPNVFAYLTPMTDINCR